MEEGLLNMIFDINRRRLLLEEECNILKDLLKPWPSKKIEPTKAGDADQCPKDDKELCKKDDQLSSEENQALIKVEKLLQKAHVTRQSKIRQDVDKYMRTSTRDSANVFDTQNTPEPYLLAEDGCGNPSNQDSSLYCSVKSSREKTASTGHTKSCSSRGVGNSSAPVSKPLQRYAKQLMPDRNKSISKTTHSQKQVSQRDKVARPVSGGGARVPVHMSAPFKTDENIKMPGRKTMQSHLHPKTKSMNWKIRPGSGLGSNSYSALPAIRGSKDFNHNAGVGSKDDNHGGECDNISGRPYSDNNRSPDPEESYSISSSTPDEAGNLRAFSQHNIAEEDSKSLSKVAESSPSLSYQMKHSEQRLPQCPEVMEQSKECSPPFILRKNGCSLKIPGKLAKLVKQNSSIREQCSTAQLLRKVSPGNTGQHFIQRLQETWEISEELWTRVRTLACLRSHKKLFDMLNKLNLAEITEQSSFKDLYRTKRQLEFVLSVFSSLQQESDYLSQVQFKVKDDDASIDKSYRDFKKVIGDTSFTLKQPDVGNWDIEEHLRGCEKFMHLKFMEGYLQLQFELLELVHEEWWHISSMDSRDPSLLQALYSLVSTGGQHLPTFVTNQI